jgi:Zn-finger nucleic acid-binding protein
MKCPVDGTELHLAERQGVEIEYCPRCRGVWLDRNELDKIIDRSVGLVQPSAREGGPGYREEAYRPSPEHPSSRHRRREREGFLEDLFDFGD